MSSTDTAFQKSEEIQSMQEKKLKELLSYLSLNSPFYKELFSTHKIDINKINSIEDLRQIPTTSKDDMQKRNWDFLCVERNKLIEYTATSGTMGSPVIIALTSNDIERLAINEHGSFVCAGGTKEDVYMLMLTLDRQFMAGLAYYLGLRKLGSGIIRLGPVIPGLQLENIQRLKPTAIVAVPSQILKLIEFAKENNFDLSKTSVKKAICIGENIRNADLTMNTLGKKITDEWSIKLYSTYASTEMQTAFTECGEGRGGHHQPELIIIELLDEEGNHVKQGEPGEVTITTLGVEAMPLLRYRTGDMCIQYIEPCKCGRVSSRLSPILGRKNQLIKLKGTTIYPPALFDILNNIKGIEEYIAEVFSNEFNTDEVILHVFTKNQSEEFDKRVKSDLQARLRVIPKINYVSLQEIQLMQNKDVSRKTVKLIDRRGK